MFELRFPYAIDLCFFLLNKNCLKLNNQLTGNVITFGEHIEGFTSTLDKMQSKGLWRLEYLFLANKHSYIHLLTCCSTNSLDAMSRVCIRCGYKRGVRSCSLSLRLYLHIDLKHKPKLCRQKNLKQNRH